MRRLRPLFLTLAFLLLVFLIGLARYVYIRGFTSKWRGYVTQEFRKRGFELSLRRLTLDPGRGLVAKEVVVYDAKDRRRVVAVIDQMILQVNYANLARGKMFLEALDLRAANLSLPLNADRPNGQKIKITKLNARLFFPQPESIQLASAEARIFGIQVFATGRLINPQAFHPSPAGSPAVPSEWIERILSEIDELKYDGPPPVIGLRFSGDLAHPEKVSFDLDLWGERIVRRRRLIKSLYASISCRDGVIDVRQVKAADTAGEFRMTGVWNAAAQTAQLHAHSTVDAPALAHAFRVPMTPLDDYVFYAQPEVDVRAEWFLGRPQVTQISGHIGVGKFACKSVVFERGSADFSWNNGSWSARDIHLRHRTGEASGDVMQVPGEFRARLKSTINPNDLQPLLTGVMTGMFAPLSFPKPPEFALEALGVDPTPDKVVVDGTVKLGPAAFNGVESNSRRSSVHYQNHLLTVAPFLLNPAEGRTGNLRFDFQSSTVTLD